MTDYCDSDVLICASRPHDLKEVEDDSKNIWIIAILLVFFAILLFVCVRKWFVRKFCRDNDSDSHYGSRYNSDEQLSQTDRDRRRRRFSN